MANLQTALHARLTGNAGVTAALGDRLFWNIVPQGTALPYGQMKTISDLRPQHLRGYDDGRRARVQVDVYAATYAAARAGADAIIAATAAPATVAGVRFGRCKAEGPRDLTEEVTAGLVHRLSLDLMIEHALA